MSIGLPLPERITNTHVYFWGSVYSNWFERRFTWRDLPFKNSETALMYAKAIFFGDESSARKIIESDHDPETVKGFGRNVKPYDDAKWSAVREEIMVSILVAKFSQHQDLFDILLSHKDHYIVEASPVDRLWGVKLHWSNERILDHRNWKGLNLLGNALMHVQLILGMRTSLPIFVAHGVLTHTPPLRYNGEPSAPL